MKSWVDISHVYGHIWLKYSIKFNKIVMTSVRLWGDDIFFITIIGLNDFLRIFLSSIFFKIVLIWPFIFFIQASLMHIKFFYRRNARQVSLMSFKVSSNLFQGDLNRKHKPGISHQQDIEILYESYIKQKVHKRKISSIVKISLNLVSFKWEVWLTIKSGSIHNFLLMEMPVQSPLEFFFFIILPVLFIRFFLIMLLFSKVNNIHRYKNVTKYAPKHQSYLIVTYIPDLCKI